MTTMSDDVDNNLMPFPTRKLMEEEWQIYPEVTESVKSLLESVELVRRVLADQDDRSTA